MEWYLRAKDRYPKNFMTQETLKKLWASNLITENQFLEILALRPDKLKNQYETGYLTYNQVQTMLDLGYITTDQYAEILSITLPDPDPIIEE